MDPRAAVEEVRLEHPGRCPQGFTSAHAHTLLPRTPGATRAASQTGSAMPRSSGMTDRGGIVHVLEADPELAADLSEEAAAVAPRAAVAPLVRSDAGTWAPGAPGTAAGEPRLPRLH